MPLQFGQVVERVRTVQLARMDQTHEQVADLCSVQRLVKQRILPVQNRLLQSTFANIMPTPGLCRVAALSIDQPASRRLLTRHNNNASPARQICQTRRDDMTTPTVKAGTTENRIDDQIEPFLSHLRAAGYAQRTLRKKRTVARAFARWTRRRQIVIDDLNDSHIAEFVARSPGTGRPT